MSAANGLPDLPKEDMTLHLLPGEPIQSRKRYTANQMTAYGIHCADTALARLARTAAPSEPTDVPYMIVFDDQDVKPELLIGRERALIRYKQISQSWNAHLFVKIDSNSRDQQSPSAPAPTDKQAMSHEDMMAIVNASPAIASGLPLAPAPLEAQPIPTGLSKRLREMAVEGFPVFNRIDVVSIIRDAADEIDRYYGGMLAWKAAAEEKDCYIAELKAAYE